MCGKLSWWETEEEETTENGTESADKK